MRIATPIVFLMVLAGFGAASAEAPEPAVIPLASVVAEESDVLPLAPATPHRVFVTDAWKTGGTRIIDGDTARLVGLIDSPTMSNFLIDPLGRYFYTAETIWTRGNRGKRQDLLTVYDQRTLALLFEIDLPGRLLVGNARQALAASADGNLLYVYNFDPSTSVTVVDIARRKVVATPSIPGCGLVYPFAVSSFASLCAEGSVAATVIDAHRRASNSRSPPLFDSKEDPLFEQGEIDRSTGDGYFISYSGLLYQSALAATPPLATPWSVQEAAGLARAHMIPGEVDWRPGGIQPLAYHRASGRLFVLMHVGEVYTHDAAGTEVWVVDVRAQKVTSRHKLKAPAACIVVSQDSEPLLFLNGGDALTVLNPATGQELRRIEHVGDGILTVAELR